MIVAEQIVIITWDDEDGESYEASHLGRQLIKGWSNDKLTVHQVHNIRTRAAAIVNKVET